MEKAKNQKRSANLILLSRCLYEAGINNAPPVEVVGNLIADISGEESAWLHDLIIKTWQDNAKKTIDSLGDCLLNLDCLSTKHGVKERRSSSTKGQKKSGSGK